MGGGKSGNKGDIVANHKPLLNQALELLYSLDDVVNTLDHIYGLNSPLVAQLLLTQVTLIEIMGKLANEKNISIQSIEPEESMNIFMNAVNFKK